MQQLILNIKNENIMNKLLWMLSHFKDDGIEIEYPKTKNEKRKTKFTDEYIEENWQTVVSEALAEYDSDYEKSFEYKIDRANFQDLKGKM
jgi:hypothetical protein